MINFLRRLFVKPNNIQELKENPPEAVEKLPSGAELMSRVMESSRQSEDFNYYETATNECRKTETPPKRELSLTRKYAKTEIDKFLDVKQKTRIIIFDIETNGLYASCSVLSCSAIKYEIDPDTHEMTEIDRFNRYYYPVEQFNPGAIDVNGLTRDVIAKKRGDETYPEHFQMDSGFETFCSDTKRFVAHNISFDVQFIPFMGGQKKFCTMITNTDIVCASFLEWINKWKWPNLSETAIHYGTIIHDEA
jgi:DNA polymerase-3 subunit epsilon